MGVRGVLVYCSDYQMRSHSIGIAGATGLDHVRRTVQASNFNGEKLVHARKWIDEQEHGEEEPIAPSNSSSNDVAIQKRRWR